MPRRAWHGYRSINRKVQFPGTWSNSIILENATPKKLISIVGNKELSAGARSGLQSIADQKRQIAEVSASLDNIKSQIDDVTTEENRLRQNIDSLNRVKGQEEQVAKYSSDVATNEANLAKLREQSRSLGQRKITLESRLRDSIQRVEF